MKKLLLSLVALMAIGVSVWADNVSIPNTEVRQGKSGVLQIILNVDTKTTYSSIAADIQLPDGISCEEMTFKQEVSEGVFEEKTGPKAELTDVTTGFSVASSYINDDDSQNIRVLAFASTQTINYGENGEFILLTVPFNASSELAIDTELNGIASNIHLGTSGGKDVAMDDVNFIIKVVEDRIIFDEMAEKLPTYTAGEKSNVRMNRTINAGKWSTIVLPFTLTQAKAQNAFGTDVQLAEFTGFETTYSSDEDVTPDGIELKFTTYTMGAKKGMTGGKLYLIKTSSDVTTFDADDVTMVGSITDATAADEYDTAGKYTGSFVKTIVPADGLFISDNKFYYSTGATVIKGFRGWFELDAVLGKETPFGVKMFIDGLPTNINDINFVNAAEGVFTIDGKKMNNDVTKLPKGVYIIDGKKVAIK